MNLGNEILKISRTYWFTIQDYSVDIRLNVGSVAMNFLPEEVQQIQFISWNGGDELFTILARHSNSFKDVN